MRHFASLLVCGFAGAQGSIYIVDASGGPGAQFTQIQAAVAAVPSGSTLVVRPGTYAPVAIDAKAITILGATGVIVSGVTAQGPLLRVRNTLGSQAVIVRGLLCHGANDVAVLVENAAGPVTLDGAGGQLLNGAWGRPALSIADSSQVDVRNWSVQGAMVSPTCTVTNSSVVFERCSLNGTGGFFMSKGGGPPSQPGLVATNSQVQFVHTVASGGNGSIGFWGGGPIYIGGAAAVVLSSSSLRAMGLAAHVILGGVNPPVGTSPAIAGTGTARVEPQIPLTAGVAAGIQLTLAQMPSLLATSAEPGGTITCERHGPAGVLTAVAISLRAPASSLPSLPDPLWLDGATLVFEAAAVATAAPLVVTKPVPNVPTLVGFECVWQAVDLDSTGLLALSNPTPSFVR